MSDHEKQAFREGLAVIGRALAGLVAALVFVAVGFAIIRYDGKQPEAVASVPAVQAAVEPEAVEFPPAPAAAVQARADDVNPRIVEIAKSVVALATFEIPAADPPAEPVKPKLEKPKPKPKAAMKRAPRAKAKTATVNSLFDNGTYHRVFPKDLG